MRPRKREMPKASLGKLHHFSGIVLSLKKTYSFNRTVFHTVQKAFVECWRTATDEAQAVSTA